MDWGSLSEDQIDQLIVEGEREIGVWRITHLWVTDLGTGEMIGRLIHDEDREPLRDLSLDGRWITAAVQEPDGVGVGSNVADIMTQTVETTAVQASVALAGD